MHEQFAEDLALLALGALSADEAANVRKHLDQCVDCRQEYRRLCADTALLALSVEGPTPPEHAKKRLIGAIENEPRLTNIVPNRARWWAIAPLFTTALVAVFAILLWKENMDLNRDYAALNDEMQITRKHLQEASHLLAELSSPNTVNATLVSANQKPQPQCRIIYLRKTGTLVIAANNLPALPGNKVFELWIIPADGSAPVPAGLFRPDDHGYASIAIANKISPNTQPKAFAVTIEPESGSDKPTSAPVMTGQ